ncbi:sulfatase-like hydrolase/transferase [Thalassotalea sp. ND16A]|uniref:sulfatase-like hydrolase/transferase n=1 Tax=Thalassotalea sp. ND16A TaxID=1535422 RepID=UPI00051D7EBA|nr:sulfatase-like hydrolase/transferase [Thalassotalea sp. ND16A]KGK00085.1 hypothetical protein ND16A_0276 [Thalassotalea sp. ND16A]
MYKIKSILLSLSLAASVSSVYAEELLTPNILWLTFEDTSAYELSVYGNDAIELPTIESIAKKGLVFNNVSSAAPYCSPARSSLISGAYATTYGSDHHRAVVETPAQRLYFPALLKQAGYYTTNNTKRDYNVTLDKKELGQIWHEFDKKASYNSAKREDGQPFFAVFNSHLTHMSRLTSYTLDGRRNFSDSGVDKNSAPRYLPDLNAVKSDYQFHLEGVKDIDSWVKIFVDDLKARNLYDNTIIFIFSDHGGSSPRGKGYLYVSTSLQVPLIVHVPEKYKTLLPQANKELESKMLSFIDFGPTILSLAGIDTPAEMQGQAFLGEKATHNRVLNFGFRTNQERHFDPMRSVTDGNYSYIKNYLRRKPMMLRNDFQWGMPSNIALDEFAKTADGQTYSSKFYQTKPTENLYYRPTDRFEQKDLMPTLSAVSEKRLQKFRKEVSQHIRTTKDIGFVPLAFKKGKAYKDWFANDFDLAALHDLAELVSEVTVDDIPELTLHLKSKHNVLRFWAAQGFAELAAFEKIKQVPSALVTAVSDNEVAVATVAIEALVYLKAPNAVQQLLKAKSKEHQRSALETIAHINPELLLDYVDEIKKIPQQETAAVILSALGLKSAQDIASNKQLKKGRKVNEIRRKIKIKPI